MISLNHCEPWTEEEFFTLGEWRSRIQLFDGTLIVTPGHTLGHQRIARELADKLDPGADARGMHVLNWVYLQLKPGRIPIPDLVVTSDIDLDEPVVPAHAAKLVGEVMSPESTAIDQVLKMHCYAEAGIPWYLLVEQETIMLRLHRLQDGTYVEDSTTRPGQVLELIEPVTAEIRPESLLPPR